MNRSREIIFLLLNSKNQIMLQLKTILVRKIKRSGKCFFQMQHRNVEMKVFLSILSAIAAKGDFEATYCFKVFNPNHLVKEEKVNIPHIGLFDFAS